ncbi:MAG: SUMF1/EgtB/PvdO family nonheme iron enzyme, partial [Actinomycetota bacterium]
ATRQLMAEGATPPSGARLTPVRPKSVGVDDVDAGEIEIPAGRHRIGVDRHDAPWAFDNELAAHEREVAAFAIDRTPVTNGRFEQFIEADGYRRDELWSEAGRRWRDEAGLVAPQFWGRDGSTRTVIRFGRTVELDRREPVQHVCWYEAEAFAAWAGKRLPTEFEWEVAASVTPDGDKRRHPWGDAGAGELPANLGQLEDGPRPVGSNPAGRSPWGCDDMLGDVWEWTASDFAPYPGFAAFPYREYSEVFWGDGLKVLRGGSWAVDPVAVSTTFRNWDLPIRRQIFAGFRCARTL